MWNSFLSPLERERLLHYALHRWPCRVSGRVERDESEVFAGALQQSAVVLELASSVEEQGRMRRERSDRGDISVVDCVARELPHRSARARRLAPVRNLPRLRGGGLHGPARRKHRRANGRRGLLWGSRDGKLPGP